MIIPKISLHCIFNDLSNRVCFPNKTEGLDIHVFNIITGNNEPKILTKDICEFNMCKFNKYKFDEIKFTSEQWWSNDKCQY